MERGIQETDANGVALESLVQLLEVALLVRQNLSQSSLTLLSGVRADHLAECGDSVSLEEHVLGTAQTDTLSAQLTSLLCVGRSISIGTNLQLTELVCPTHDDAEVTGDLSVNSLDDAVVDVTGGTVDGDIVTLGEGLACELPILPASFLYFFLILEAFHEIPQRTSKSNFLYNYN